MTRVVIAGSRTVTDYDEILAAMAFVEPLLRSPVSAVLCGEARGADTLGRRWATERGIPVESFPADWTLYKKKAGFIRNVDMLKNADVLVAIWNGYSPGTAHAIRTGRALGLPVFEIPQRGARA